MRKTVPILVCLVMGFAIINSCKKDPAIPTLTTKDVTNITINSVTTGGAITNDGGAGVTGRGVCWGTSASPTIEDSYTSDDSGIGSFVSSITDLTPNTEYHIRAYATNKAGTAYGQDISFTTTAILLPTLTTTAITSVTLATAVSGGNITADGNAAITAKGVCWATTTAPAITNSLTTDGTGIGSFVSSLTGLLPGTIYFVRAYATNSAGTAYGNEISFTSGLTLVPTLTTTVVSAITYTTASSGGNIAADGGSPVTAKGVCWAITINPTITNSLTSNGTGTGIFTSSLTGLIPGTVYHVRAYAINSGGTAYGNDVLFTTNPILLPTLTTAAVTSITYTTAVSGGNITFDGGGAVTTRGVCWAITINPTITNFKTDTGTGTGAFVSNLTSLLPGTVYHVRAFATNSAGTAYGTDISFTTNPVILPTVTTTAISAIGVATASSGGNVTNAGGGTTARGVCWAISANPTISNSLTSNGTGTGIFTSSLTGLSAGTTYYLRAYATNIAGTTYGSEVSFNTKIADGDGKTYSTVLIGTQLWMGENLNTTKYNNGVSIGTTATPTDDVTLLTTPYQWPVYNGGTDISATYGRLYTWSAVTDSRNVCPTGWHVPTDTELEALKTTLGGDAVAGGELKEAGLTHWTTPNTGATNSSGFTALAAGYRQPNGSYVSLGLSCYLWSISPDGPLGWGQGLRNDDAVLLRGGYEVEGGVSVRCLK